MGVKLTKRAIDALEPGAVIWDAEIKGLGVRASKRGLKTFFLKYRRGAVQRWYTIGPLGSPWTPATARREALKLVGQIAAGLDPVAQRMLDRKSESFEAFADRFIEEYAKPHKKASSVQEDIYNLRKHAKPALGRLKVPDIQRSDVAKLHSSMRNTPYAANRTRALLSKIFNWAESEGLRPDGSNPCKFVKPYPEKPRKTELSEKELLRLGKALNKAEESGSENIYVISAIRLLLFTGARVSEILGLRRDSVNFRMKIAHLADSKTGEKSLPLPAPALTVLKSLPKQKDNPYFICGKKPGSHLVNIQRPWRRIRKAAKLEHVRLNDCRHNFGGGIVDSGYSLRMVGAILGHTRAQTSMRYAAVSNDPRLKAADTVAAQIAAKLEGKKGNVVPLKKGNRRR